MDKTLTQYAHDLDIWPWHAGKLTTGMDQIPLPADYSTWSSVPGVLKENIWKLMMVSDASMANEIHHLLHFAQRVCIESWITAFEPIWNQNAMAEQAEY